MNRLTTTPAARIRAVRRTALQIRKAADRLGLPEPCAHGIASLGAGMLRTGAYTPVDAARRCLAIAHACADSPRAAAVLSVA